MLWTKIKLRLSELLWTEIRFRLSEVFWSEIKLRLSEVFLRESKLRLSEVFLRESKLRLSEVFSPYFFAAGQNFATRAAQQGPVGGSAQGAEGRKAAAAAVSAAKMAPGIKNDRFKKAIFANGWRFQPDRRAAVAKLS